MLSPFCQHAQLSSVAQSCLTLCNPMNRSTPGLPVHHQLSEFTQTHVHQVGDAIQSSHPLFSPSLPAPNPSQHQGLFQRVNSSHEVPIVYLLQKGLIGITVLDLQVSLQTLNYLILMIHQLIEWLAFVNNFFVKFPWVKKKKVLLFHHTTL